MRFCCIAVLVRISSIKGVDLIGTESESAVVLVSASSVCPSPSVCPAATEPHTSSSALFVKYPSRFPGQGQTTLFISHTELNLIGQRIFFLVSINKEKFNDGSLVFFLVSWRG